MKAVILAGGRGRRLEPYTTIIPKPLAPVGEMPILEIVLRQLLAAGFDDITLTLGHLGELIQAFLTTRQKPWDPDALRLVYEDKPTGTAGSLTLVPDLDETFLALNGDVLTTLDFRAMMEHHRRSGAALTVAVHRQVMPLELGVLDLDDATGRVVGYREKPELVFPVSMGVYVYEPKVLERIPRGEYYDLPSLVLDLLEAGETVGAYQTDCLWLDIGRPQDFARAQEAFEAHRDEFLLG